MSIVMIAENEVPARKRIERVLAQENLDVVSVSDGRALQEEVATKEPDVLLLDVAMPGLDGMTVLEKLRERSENLQVVLMIDKRASLKEIVEAIQQGATEYISKPVDTKDLLQTVRRVLARARNSRTMLDVPLRELHDPTSGRIDAKRVAEFLGIPLAHLAEALGANYPAVHKSPASLSLQERLRPIKRSVELLSRATRTPADLRAWLHNPHPDLGERTPMEVILNGRAGAVVTLLENALAGIPS